jgi:hypothetical protein
VARLCRTFLLGDYDRHLILPPGRGRFLRVGSGRHLVLWPGGTGYLLSPPSVPILWQGRVWSFLLCGDCSHLVLRPGRNRLIMTAVLSCRQNLACYHFVLGINWFDHLDVVNLVIGRWVNTSARLY